MKIYLARHAQSSYNVLLLCNGDPLVNVQLTDLGIQQAHKLASDLSTAEYEAVFISELPRTRQTAEIINANHNKPVIVDNRINENKTGFEGKPVQDWIDAIRMSGNKWTASFNDGESLAHAKQRASIFLEDLRARPYKSVLIVTHGFITQAIYALINDVSDDDAARYDLTQGTYDMFEI